MRTYITHIYIETETRGPRIKEAEYSYALEAVACESSHMVGRSEGVGKATGNEYSILLLALEEAVGRIKKSDHSDIVIHTECGKFADDVRSLDKWIHNDFRKSNRQPIRNAGRWKKIAAKLIGHKYRIDSGQIKEAEDPPHVEAST